MLIMYNRWEVFFTMQNIGNMKQIERTDPKVYHLPNWANGDDNARMDVISDIIQRYGRDPKIATKCVDILRQYKIEPRDYVGQCAALLKWVQDNIYYVNEPGERLQDPNYTLKVGYGDCDDMAIVLCSFFESMRLPWKLVISGRGSNGLLRYIHRHGHLPKADWSHIYCMVSANPFQDSQWFYCEPTIKNVPLGWDVVSANSADLPELLAPGSKAAEPKQKLPELGNVRTSAIIGGTLAAETQLAESTDAGIEWNKMFQDILKAVLVGVATSYLSNLLLPKD